MRPPQFAGENETGTITISAGDWGFNEAPAIRGGKQSNKAPANLAPTQASMRPPQFAGENEQADDVGKIGVYQLQ